VVTTQLILTQSLSAPLKLLGQTLDLDVHTIPSTKRDFKNWKVCISVHSFHYSIYLNKRAQPPEPFFPLDGTVPPSHHLLVTASFGRILRKSHLELFHSSRRLNVHPSLLPDYRGPAPIQRALINDEKQTGVCIIEMLQQKAGIDCGDIWGQQTTVRRLLTLVFSFR
jgi:methionyl-tRNA formyltransferase